MRTALRGYDGGYVSDVFGAVLVFTFGLTTLVMHFKNPPAEVLEFIPYWHNYPPPKFIPESIIASPLLFELPLSFDLMISASLPVLRAFTRNPRADGPLPMMRVST